MELEYAGGYVGWVMAYDKRTLEQSGVFATVTTGNRGGGVWQSGRPPVVDNSGYVYVFVGNGYSNGYDGVNNFSESALKLDPANGLSVGRLVHGRQLELPGCQRPRPRELRAAADPGHEPAGRRRQDR